MIKGYNFSRCENPRIIKNRYTGENVEVSCGCCKACMLHRRDRMTTFCQTEEKKYRYCLFVTLTYDNDHVPLLQPIRKENKQCYRLFNLCHRFKNLGSMLHLEHDCYHVDSNWLSTFLKKLNMPFIPYANVRDLQLFLKKLRKNLSFYTDEKIRYYAVSEYGPVHFRPHYHLLLFFNEEQTNTYIGRCIRLGWAYRYRKTIKFKKKYKRAFKKKLYKECSKTIYKVRRYGRIHYELTKGSASSYVAQYLNCSVSLPKFYSFLSFLKPFSLHSTHFGYPFSQSFKEEVYEDEHYRFSQISQEKNGKLYSRELQNSFKSWFYPKCRGYQCKTIGELYKTYTIYSAARQFYGVEEVNRLANYIWFDVHQSLDNYPLSYFYKILQLCPDYQHVRLSKSKDFDRLFLQRIQSDLYLSKHFVKYVCDDNPSLYFKRVNQIVKFWRHEDYKRLVKFYNTQSEYVRDYPNSLDYLPFMYFNFVDYFNKRCLEFKDDLYNSYITENFQNYVEYMSFKIFNLQDGNYKFNHNFKPNFKDHYFFNVLQSDSNKEFEFSIKHKTQNDLNNALKNL